MPRLGRLEELWVDEPIYFLTACLEGRRPLLNNPESHESFRRFCHKAVELGILVGRYVLMPEHVHLFVWFPETGPELSMWIKSLKSSMSKHWRRQKIPAPHWQKGFFDHVLRSPEPHERKWEYVVQNPVRAGLVARPEDWPYAGCFQPDDWP